MNDSTENPAEHASPAIDRRALLVGSTVAAVGMAGYPLWKNILRKRWPVFIARGQRYDGALRQTIQDGLLATGFRPNNLRGKRVLLKPNLVEPLQSAPHMTTHPAMVLAAAEVFRGWGAHVVVGEAPAHLRDTEMALVESGLQEVLDAAKLEFADLNYEDVGWIKNAGGACKLKGFYLPRSVLEADLIVSMPKMKTHHWMGFTASMKNLYGVFPGIKYGWPKNVLHYAGIPQTVFDINATLPKTIAIVDGIVCMEGDGPIMGSAKQMGLVIVGTNRTAVDATVGRIMGLEPSRVSYLQLAGNRLGPIEDRYIEQRGEQWEPLVSPFLILDRPHLKALRTNPGALISATETHPSVRIT